MADIDYDIAPLLEQADNNDLGTLVEYILKASWTEELSSNPVYKVCTPDHKKYVHAIISEIRKFGGNTFANTFRGEGPSYHEIVCDVADKVGAKYTKKYPVEAIEEAILIKLAQDSWEKMTNEEKAAFCKELNLDVKDYIPKALPVMMLQTVIKSSGFAAYKFAVIIANAVSKAILGRGLAIAANAGLNRAIAIFAGPIGWVITALWTAYDIAGPAYRVTIPCVVHIAMLRQKYSLSAAERHA